MELQFRNLSGSCLLLLLTCFTISLPSQGSTHELLAPQRVIQDISDRLAEIMLSQRERLESDPAFVYQLANDVLLPHIDFERVSSLVLGKHWRRATPEQREEFAAQFQRLLVRTYSTAFHEFREWQIEYGPLKMQEGDEDIQVLTRVHRSGAPPVDVVYRMHLNGNDWAAYDITIEGVSLVTNYRNSFANEIRRRGIDGLIQRIMELNDRRSEKKAEAS